MGKYYPPASGGIETHTQTLARAQAQAGADVRVLVVNHATPAGQDVTFSRWARTEDTIDHDGPVAVYRVGKWAQFAKLDLAPNLLRVLAELHRNPPDVWHLHAPNVTMMAAILADRRIRPLVITHHSDIVRQIVLKHAIRPIENAVYSRAVKLLSDSPPYIDGSQILMRFRKKVESLPLGLDLTPYQQPSAKAQEYAAELRRRHSEPIWCSVGRLVYYKALEIALTALREVPGTLIIIGTGPMETQWKKLAQELGVADRVVWAGRATDDELVGTYLASTALWFPSNARSEGFGLVQVEAMPTGCPVINTSIPHSGVPWVCQNEIAGLTVPINNAPAFATACRRLLEETGLKVRLGNGGRRRASAEFGMERMAIRCCNVYHDSCSDLGDSPTCT